MTMESFPNTVALNWTIQEFGPLVIPRKGLIMKVDQNFYLLYKQLISWEQKKKIRMDGKHILLNDSIIEKYEFIENYYFVSGDNMANSQDSRYWGMLPEPYIVGKAVYIWKSEDLCTGKIRWDRVMKKIRFN